MIPQNEYEERVGRKVVKVALHLEKRRHVELGDFVISMRSFQGGLERAWAAGCIRSSYVVLRPSTRTDTDFFTYLFKSRGYIGALQATADFIRDGQDLNFDNFAAVPLPLPPLHEQASIAQALGSLTASISAATQKEIRMIPLIRELRTRLIADVVTGKLDVREAAARLPDGAEDEGVLDDLDGGEEEEDDELDAEKEDTEA